MVTGLIRLFARAAYRGDPELSETPGRPIATLLRQMVRDMLNGAVERGEIRANVELEATERTIHALTLAVGDSQLRPIVEVVIADLSLSSDLFRGEAMMTETARYAIEAARTLGLPEAVLSVETPEGCAAYPQRDKREPTTGGAVQFRGRVVAELTEGVPRRPWTKFTECPDEDLYGRGRMFQDLGCLAGGEAALAPRPTKRRATWPTCLSGRGDGKRSYPGGKSCTFPPGTLPCAGCQRAGPRSPGSRAAFAPYGAGWEPGSPSGCPLPAG